MMNTKVRKLFETHKKWGSKKNDSNPNGTRFYNYGGSGPKPIISARNRNRKQPETLAASSSTGREHDAGNERPVQCSRAVS